MISWGTILYGAALSGLAAAAVSGIVLRERSGVRLIAVAISALGAPIGWNAILRATHASQFFTDAPIALFPASWQDTGSGVFTLAVASVILTLVAPRLPARRLLVLASVTGLVAFLVDVYLY